MGKSLRVATAGVLTALSVIFLALGSIIWVFSYTMPLLCGIVLIIVVESYNKKTALLIYLSVSVLSLIMISDKESALLYVMLTGYYPIILENIEKLRFTALRIAVKLLLFNTSVIAAELICVYVFGIPFDNMMGKVGIIILIALANAILFAYDRLLKNLTALYVKKYKNRVEKFLK